MPGGFAATGRDALMAEAIRFVTAAGHEAPWLPTAEESLSDNY